MPYTSCPRCGIEEYSAAAWSTQDRCPSCDGILPSQQHWSMGAAFGSALHRRLTPNAAAPLAARRVLDALAESMDDSLLDTARLLASELVTNSVDHGPNAPATIEMRASVDGGRLRVEVSDAGEGIEGAFVEARDDALYHWGLVLVDTLADRWGSESTPQVASVWFELDGATSHDGPRSGPVGAYASVKGAHRHVGDPARSSAFG